AGHQRTKALRKLGITHAAVYVLPCETTVYDEVRFNQLHNGTDFDSGDERCRVSGLEDKHGFVQVSASQISGNMRAKMAYVRKNIAELVIKYGPWGGCVATQSGEVIHCAQYALAAKMTRTPLTVFVIPDVEKEKYQSYLNKTYGVFEYSHLEKTTYIQTYAQLMRLRNGGSLKSNLYESLILPIIAKTPRGIDFGSGQGDYARMLRAKGYNLHDLELFRRKGAGNTLDRTATNRMIDTLVDDLKTRGRYDYVICDSVLNSVDSVEAEWSVLTVLKGLCQAGGSIFFSGRSRGELETVLKQTQAASSKSRLYFIDHNGFTALYRKGHWFYQKFHSDDEVKQLCRVHGFRIKRSIFNCKSWYLHVINDDSLSWASLEKAVRFEFELPLPGGSTIGRSDDVLAAFRPLIK
uniref:class I SAM-dependent methyltransferase n=1 Tax=Escherichia albertii TaxID=208962 RepID=UPI0013749801